MMTPNYTADNQPSISAVLNNLNGLLTDMRRELHDAIERGDMANFRDLATGYADIERAYHRIAHARRRIMGCAP
jgi:hypothetical protein